MNELNSKIDEILYAFSNYWREGAHDTMPPGEWMTATQARKALLSLFTKQVRLGKEDLIRIARERLENDDTYTLDAWVEDAEEYLSRTKSDTTLLEGVDNE